jgi:hypothetical protein
LYQPNKNFSEMHYTEKQKVEPIKKVLAKQHYVQVQTEVLVQEKAVFLKKEQAVTHYLKIYPQYRPGSKPVSPGKTIPQLQICGDWLKDAGFDRHAHFRDRYGWIVGHPAGGY